MVQLLLKNVFQLWIKTQLVLLFVFFTLSTSLQFQPPSLFSLCLKHLFFWLLLPHSTLFSFLTLCFSSSPASRISLSFSHSPPSWRCMLICQALCILQPPATVALKWHHTGGLGLSPIYAHTFLTLSPYIYLPPYSSTAGWKLPCGSKKLMPAPRYK